MSFPKEEKGEKMKSWKRYWRIARVWRVVILSLFFSDVGLGVAYWALTGDLYGATRLIVHPLLVIIGAAIGSHYLFSVNIFGKMWKSPSPSGRRFVFLCALGLYSSVVAAIFLVSFLFLLMLQIPGTFVLAIVGVELALFSVVGYIGFIRLRRNMRRLSETGSSIVGN